MQLEVTAPLPLTNAYSAVSSQPIAQKKSIVFFGRPNFIQWQRITGIALMAFSALAGTLLPMLMPWMAIGIAVGSALIGLSLIQQVIAQSPGCKHGKVTRIAAGILFIAAGSLLSSAMVPITSGLAPLCWIYGGIFWSISKGINRSWHPNE